MEFINGNCTLTKDEHKALVKFLYEQSHAEGEMLDKLNKLGIASIEGPLANLVFDSFTVLGHVTPAHIAEQDRFCNDFCDADDFEYFYNKYFEGEF